MSRIQPVLDRLEIPVIIAPMFLVSSPAMALAACSEGVMGSFPAHSTRTREVLAQWLQETEDGLKRLEDGPRSGKIGPFALNLVVHRTNPRYEGDLELCIKHKVPVVLTSKGAPGEAVKRIHDYGGVVLHDVASQRHAEKAIEAGVDGVIAVAGGAGGHTGTINPFALVNEIRRIWDGVIVLAGGMSTGRDVLATEAMGADLAYFGTRFIPTAESIASEEYKQSILASKATDIFFTASIDGAPANYISKSLTDAGIDLDVLRKTLPSEIINAHETKKRWKDIWSAGHGVGNIDGIIGTAELCRQLKSEYQTARTELRTKLA